MFCDIYLQSVHITTIHDLFIYFIFKFSWPILHPRFPILDSRSSILAPDFPEKLDVGFLFYGHEVLEVECVTVKYKATRLNKYVA